MSNHRFRSRAPLAALAAWVLVSAPGWAQDKPLQAASPVQALAERVDAELKAYRELASAAKSAEEKEAAKAKLPDWAKYAREFKDLAVKAGQTETAALAWSKAFSCAAQSRSDDTRPTLIEALKALTTDHLDSEQLPGVLNAVPYYMGQADGEAALQRVVDQSKVDANRALALSTLAEQWTDDTDPARIAKGKQALERLGKDWPNLKDPGSRTGETFGQTSQRKLEHLSKYGIGATAPEIEGEDIAGVKFKLSDYRGKVVLLDFWGNW